MTQLNANEHTVNGVRQIKESKNTGVEKSVNVNGCLVIVGQLLEHWHAAQWEHQHQLAHCCSWSISVGFSAAPLSSQLTLHYRNKRDHSLPKAYLECTQYKRFIKKMLHIFCGFTHKLFSLKTALCNDIQI